MTEKTQPTDAELKAMWQLHAADIGGIFCYARAVLAKWGTPTMTEKPMAFLVCTEEGDPDMVFLDRHEAQQYLEDDEQPIPLYRPSQPTQPEE